MSTRSYSVTVRVNSCKKYVVLPEGILRNPQHELDVSRLVPVDRFSVSKILSPQLKSVPPELLGCSERMVASGLEVYWT